jgi:hypothetical protein
MYGLVPYNISPIQQAIQFGHAVVEYANEYFNDEDYQTWAKRDKTFMILNGGTTNKDFDSDLNISYKGSLNNHVATINSHNLKHAVFFEPDLGDQLTAVVFLVDDRIWDKEAYPDYAGTYMSDWTGTYPLKSEYDQWKKMFSDDVAEADHIAWMREFLSPRNFRFA